MMTGSRMRARGRAVTARRWAVAIAGLALLLLAPVLARAQGAGADSVTLSWTAPGDDGRVGTATLYDMRMATSAIDSTTWSSATAVSGMPAPRVAGTTQNVTVHGLTNGTTYWFAMRTRDDAGNWSGISNVVRFDWIFDTAPPAAPTGTVATKVGADVRTTWNAGSEPDLAGYHVYRAAAAGGPWTLVSGGLVTSPQFIDSAVPAGATTLWYAVTALDVSANESARGAAASVVVGSAAVAVAWGIETGYPNPSRAGTTITLPVTVPATGAGQARIEILDGGGRTVRRIDLSGYAPGSNDVMWDGRNDAGREIAPGPYTAWLIAGDTRKRARLVRLP
jgi:hypothetical protein